MQDQAKPKRPYHFHMPMEELHSIKSMAGKKGGKIGGKIGGKMSHGGGRPLAKVKMQYAVIKLYESSCETFGVCAASEGKTRVRFLHDLALSLRSDPRYAHLFATPAEPQTR